MTIAPPLARGSKIRLYVAQPLGQGQPVTLDRAQAHYLFGVMRLGQGDSLALFNGQDGEWQAQVHEAGKRGGTLLCQAQSAPQQLPPDLWLCFAPVKKSRTDFIVEKAVELGVRRLVPVATRHTNSERVRVDRLQSIAREAAEQCGATHLPQVTELQKLDTLLDSWPDDRQIMFCDETAPNGARAPMARPSGAWAILIGPEGGFAPDERARLTGMDGAHPVSLGPRILRAETAAIAALTLWQSTLGDWTAAR